LIYFKRFG